jgi:tRNA pseudouridine13 synthase
MMLAGAVLKQIHEDFVVRESAVVRLTTEVESSHHYLLLRKRGYTTMEACRLIAGALALPTQAVTYAGLKDEDAVTEQLVAVPSGTVGADVDGVGWLVAHEADRWLRLHHYGHGNDPMRIGLLEGNGFNLVVRNLDAASAARFRGLRKLSAFFLNYYDIQRFGVPGGPKRTHLVGRAMLEQRWDDALRELAGLAAPESPDTRAWRGSARDHFRQLDPRTASFYLAAASSHSWNRLLAQRVAEACPEASRLVEVEGIDYRYLRFPLDSGRLAAAAPSLPYTRYAFEDGAPVPHESHRTTVVQTVLNVVTVAEDSRSEGRFTMTVRFFLPSGCYATAVMRQLMSYDEAVG